MKKEKRAAGGALRPWAVLFWLLIWQIVSMLIDKEILLVSPVRVVFRLVRLLPVLSFWQAIAFSSIRIMGGFLLASLVGSLLAAAAFRFGRVRELLAPVMLAVKSIPVASFIILALIWFSSRSLSVLISFLMVLPVVYNNVLEGIARMDPALTEMAQLFGLPALRRIRGICLPQVYPYFVSACSTGLGLCWKAGVAAEVIGMPDGSIGERLQQAKIYLNTPELFAWTVVIVLASRMFERLTLFLLAKAEAFLERS